MSSLQIIRKRVCIEPEFLTKNYKDFLFKKIKETTNNECSKEHGYFLDVKRIVKIIDNNITSNSEIVFIVEFEVETLLPIKDKEFEGTICMIFNSGIFVNIKNKLKVLIPLSELTNYTYDSSKNVFIMKDDCENILKKDINIKITILDLRYSKKQFSCFGKII
jgi:DNA-directed RNA polymerase subunit E'/Rpb7